MCLGGTCIVRICTFEILGYHICYKVINEIGTNFCLQSGINSKSKDFQTGMLLEMSVITKEFLHYFTRKM